MTTAQQDGAAVLGLLGASSVSGSRGLWVLQAVGQTGADTQMWGHTGCRWWVSGGGNAACPRKSADPRVAVDRRPQEE